MKKSLKELIIIAIVFNVSCFAMAEDGEESTSSSTIEEEYVIDDSIAPVVIEEPLEGSAIAPMPASEEEEAVVEGADEE